MGLDRFLGQISTVMAPVLGDELAYRHVTTGEDVTVVGFLKWKSSEIDPIGKPTKRQKTPVFRVQDLPWSEDDVIGDRITALDGTVYTVTDADTRPSGWTDLFVSDRG